MVQGDPRPRLSFLSFTLNSLAPGRCGIDFKREISKHMILGLCPLAHLAKLLSGDCLRTCLMISQLWFRQSCLHYTLRGINYTFEGWITHYTSRVVDYTFRYTQTTHFIFIEFSIL